MTEHLHLADEERALVALVDLLLPASSDGRMPAASDLGLPDRLGKDAGGLREALLSIAVEARRRHACAFADLPMSAQIAVIEALRPGLRRHFTRLAAPVFQWYYQHDRVVEALGLGARAPFPEGYRVEQGDLTLLEPVCARGRIYRIP